MDANVIELPNHCESNNQTIKMYAAVILQAHRKKIVVPHMWVQKTELTRSTKIFISTDEQKLPNFTLPTRYFLSKSDACYNGIYLKSYGK